MKLLAKTLKNAGVLTVEDKPLGTGGEGSVYSVTNHNLTGFPKADEIVVKIYHNPTEGDRQQKVSTMLMNIPETDQIAWPIALTFDTNKKFNGYIMRKLDYDSFRPWAELAHSGQRKDVSSSFDVKYAIASILNMSNAVASIHEAGHIIGDINESNIFVGKDSNVFIVDSDSAQIKSKNGQIFRCLVGKPEYTAPELSHGALKDQDRTEVSDVFALAVASWQMITGGTHPTDGIFKGEGDPPSVIEKTRAGIFPPLKNNSSFTLPARIPVYGIPSRIKKLILESLNVEPNRRPTVDIFIETLSDVLQNLKQCSKVKEHWYDSRDGKCGWCEDTKNGLIDPWSENKKKVVKNQVSLAPLSFKNSGGQTIIPKRAPAQQASSQSHNPFSQQTSQPQYNSGNSSLRSNYPSYNNTNTNSGSSSQAAAPAVSQNSIPELIKGKMVVGYADGTWGVRPSLITLFKSNPKLAVKAFKVETPNYLKFWWDSSWPIAGKLGIILGLILGLIISSIWYFIPTIAHIFDTESWLSQHNFWEYISYASMGTAAFFVIYLSITAFLDRFFLKRKVGSLENYKVDKTWRTILRFIGVSLAFGPLFVFVILFGIIYGLILLIIRMLNDR